MASAPLSEHADAGRVIGRAFETLAAHFLPFFAVSLLLVGVPAFLTQYLALAAAGDTPELAILPLENWELSLGSWLAYFVGSALLQGVLVRSTILHLSGRAPDMAGSGAIALRLVLPIVGTSICVAVATGVGFIFLVVPGIMIACAFYVAVPALVEERCGVFDSIGRSRDLTRGSRFHIFLLLAFTWIISMIVTGIAGTIGVAAFGAAGPEGLPDPLFAGAADGIASALTGLIGTIIVAALYVELREVKEGTGTNELAEVFA